MEGGSHPAAIPREGHRVTSILLPSNPPIPHWPSPADQTQRAERVERIQCKYGEGN